MKRYRILSFDFDSRAMSLEPIPEQWEEKIKKQHIENQKNTIIGLNHQYGALNSQLKINNFIELKQKHFQFQHSIINF